jgi:hypothetical protein
MFFTGRKIPLSQDQQDMQLALQLLNTTEFRLFELAYKAWFGESAHESKLEHSYVPYLFTGILPCWVRQYIRNIRQLSCEAGVIRTTGLQVHRVESHAISSVVLDSSVLLALLVSMLMVLL